MMTPKARTSRILTHDVDGELVVYDQVRKQAHRLNPGAAGVWRLLDGKRSVRTIATELEVGESAVQLAIDDFAKANLLEAGVPLSVSRRKAIKRAAVAAAVGFVLPAVTSMAAPLPAQAKSGSWILDFDTVKKPKKSR